MTAHVPEGFSESIGADRKKAALQRAGVISTAVVLAVVGFITAGLAQQAPTTPSGAAPTDTAPPSTTTTEVSQPTALAPGTYVYEIIKRQPSGATGPVGEGFTSVTGTVTAEASLGAQQRQVLKWLSNKGAVTYLVDSIFEFGSDGLYVVSRSEQSKIPRETPPGEFDPSPFELAVPYPVQEGRIWTHETISRNGCMVERLWVRVIDAEDMLYVARRGVKTIRLLRLTERTSTGKAGCANFNTTETATLWLSWQFGLVQMELFEGHSRPEPVSTAVTRIQLVRIPAVALPTTTLAPPPTTTTLAPPTTTTTPASVPTSPRTG